MQWQVGQTIGDLEIVENLDPRSTRGPFKARNRKQDRSEVVHMIPGEQTDEAERLTREMRILSTLSHPGILRFLGALDLGGDIAVSTEAPSGVTLKERLVLGALPTAQALDYARQILEALECAHALGIWHHDLSPSNVVIEPNGTVKIAGFGLARQGNSAAVSLTGTSTAVEYLSPEQVRQSANIGAASDIYTVGIVLYEMAAGQPPFRKASQFDTMLAHINEAPAAPSSHPHVSASLDGVVLRALEKDPALRWESAAQFRDAVHNVLETLGRPQPEPTAPDAPDSGVGDAAEPDALGEPDTAGEPDTDVEVESVPVPDLGTPAPVVIDEMPAVPAFRLTSSALDAAPPAIEPAVARPPEVLEDDVTGGEAAEVGERVDAEVGAGLEVEPVVEATSTAPTAAEAVPDLSWSLFPSTPSQLALACIGLFVVVTAALTTVLSVVRR